MTNQTKLKLSNLVEKSDAFENFMSWQFRNVLQQNYKRKAINEKISLIN